MDKAKFNKELDEVDRHLQMEQRIADTEEKLNAYMAKSLATMLEKNRGRGDAWRASGVMGQFVEIHSMYNRLRNLVWELGAPKGVQAAWDNGTRQDNNDWVLQVQNALEDLRNFTMLAEMCLEEGNWAGNKFHRKELGEDGL